MSLAVTSIRDIAKDPHKALRDLEKDLGVGDGTLLKEMQEAAEAIGDWTQHIPYAAAADYYESAKAKALYQNHIDQCAYCQGLIETLHPTELDARRFAQDAVRAQSTHPTEKSLGMGIPFTAVASVLLTALASLFVVPTLQTAGILSAPKDHSLAVARVTAPDQRNAVVDQLRRHPDKLTRLEVSDQPLERFLAARYYFAVDKPDLAYQQIGQGLQLAGVHPVDARKITTAADLTTDEFPAADIAKAASDLHRYQATPQRDEPADYLEVAMAQAKLGLHKDALLSIERYLKAQNADPKTIADFNKVELTKPFNTITESNFVQTR